MVFLITEVIKYMTLSKPLKFKDSNQIIKSDGYALNSPFRF